MTKTNGFGHEREGMELYTIEWESVLQVKADGWKAGWNNFRVLQKPPNALAAAVEGVSILRLLRGGTAMLRGKSELQKADNGWRVITFEVTAIRMAAPPDNPTEGRSTDINAFWKAFKQVLVTKNSQAVAKFVHFPLDNGSAALNEADFHARPPWEGEELQTAIDLPSPTKLDEQRYYAQALPCTIYVTTNGDGYWKWTGYACLMDEVESPEDVVKPMESEVGAPKQQDYAGQWNCGSSRFTIIFKDQYTASITWTGGQDWPSQGLRRSAKFNGTLEASGLRTDYKNITLLSVRERRQLAVSIHEDADSVAGNSAQEALRGPTQAFDGFAFACDRP